MLKNRKSQSAGAIFGAVLKVSLLCSLVVVCCVGRVWQKKQIAELSRQYSTAEQNLKTMRAENDKMKKQLAAMMLPAALMKRAEDFKLGLEIPKPSSIWRLPEPGAEPQTRTATAVAAQQYAAAQP
jgi:hypothetical protein